MNFLARLTTILLVTTNCQVDDETETHAVPSVSIDVEGCAVGSAPHLVQLAAIITEAPSAQTLQLSWDFGDGNFVSGDRVVSHAFSTPGIHVVRLRVDGCETPVIAQTEISVAPNRTFFVANDGDDDATGTSCDSPWATLGKVNRHDFGPGDWVLFKRGDSWRGDLDPNDASHGQHHDSDLAFTDTARGQAVNLNVANPDNRGALRFADWGRGRKPTFSDGRIFINRPHIALENLRVTSNKHAQLWIHDTHHVSVRGVELRGSRGNALLIRHGGNHLLEDVLVQEYDINGIYLQGGQGANGPLHDVVVQNSNIENSYIRHGGEDAISIHDDQALAPVGKRFLLRNNRIVNANEDGIDITSGKLIVAVGNHIDSAGERAFAVGYPDVNDVEVRANFAIGSFGLDLLGVVDDARRLRFVNNVFSGTVGNHGIVLRAHGPVEIWNNAFYPRVKTGKHLIYWAQRNGARPRNLVKFRNNTFIMRGDGPRTADIAWPAAGDIQTTFDHNCYDVPDIDFAVANASVFTEWVDSGFEAHGVRSTNVVVDAQSHTAADFTLRKRSPCVDAGVDVAVSHDYAGNNRQRGAGTDMSPFER